MISLGLNVRSGPSAESTVHGELRQHARVTAWGRHGQWLRIEFDGTFGYVHGTFIDAVQSQATASNTHPASAVHATPPPNQPTMSPELQAIGERLAHNPIGVLAEAASRLTPTTNALPHGPTAPAPIAAAPLPPVSLDAVAHTELGKLAAQTGSQEAVQVARAVEALKLLAGDNIRDKRNEEKRAERNQLITGIGQVRNALMTLPATTDLFKAAVYNVLQDISPFYFQSKNVDILESASATRTCNITAVAMALESLGVTSSAYQGNLDTLLAIAQHYPLAGVALTAQFSAMRLPDFIQLVLIANELSGAPTHDAISSAGKTAWDRVIEWDALTKLIRNFGVAVTTRTFDSAGTINVEHRHRKLRSYGHKHRMPIEAVKTWEREQTTALPDRHRTAYEAALADTTMDADISIEQYRQSLLKEVAGELAGGKAVVVGLSRHFARVQALLSDAIIVDDPARFTRSATRLTYAEARAMGYFWNRIVLG